MKKAIFALWMLTSTTAFAATPAQLLESCQALLVSHEAGGSLDRYSDNFIALNAEVKKALDEDAIKDMPDFEYFKKHMKTVMDRFYQLSKLRQISERDGFKFTEIQPYGHDWNGISCYPVALGNKQACSVSELKETAVADIKQELKTIANGLKDGF